VFGLNSPNYILIYSCHNQEVLLVFSQVLQNKLTGFHYTCWTIRHTFNKYNKDIIWTAVAVRSKALLCGRSIFWDRGFEFRWGHGCSSVVFVACCIGSGVCDELTIRSEAYHRVWVMYETRQWGGLSPIWNVSPNATTCSYELSWFPSWLWR